MRVRSIFPIFPICIFLAACGVQEKETIIILARHAQTTANVDNILAGKRLDVHLTETGIEQAKQLGQTLSKKYTFDAFYASTLSRTYETGLYALGEIKSQKDLNANRLSGLDDVDYGEATGLTVEEANKRFGGVDFPDDFGPIDDPNYKPTFTTENTYEWYQRFQGALNDIVNSQKGKTSLVVTHGAAFCWGKYTFGDVVTGLGNAGYAELLYKNGTFSLIEWHV